MAPTGLGAQLPDSVKEVDFYKNPTILSRLILNQKYASAINRLQRFPEEAFIWVSSKRNPCQGRAISLRPGQKITKIQRYSSSRYALPNLSIQGLEYSVRQLPVHVACADLLRCKEDKSLRTDLELLITKLVVTNPGSCNEVDHEGKIPLHEALWHDARPETISMMLIAAPLTLHARDKYGRTPLDLNRFRRGGNKEQIKILLLRGTHFWEQARTAAMLKMEARRGEQKQGRTLQQQQEDGAIKTIYAADKQTKVTLHDGEKVQAVTWIKLERRALHLEQLLAGMYEKNYELGELVEELTQSKMELQEEFEKVQLRTPEERITMSTDNEALKLQVVAMVGALKEQSEQPENRMKPDAETIEYFEDRNAGLQEKLNDITERNREYQIEVECLELLVESFRKRVGNGSLSMDMSSIPEGEVYMATDDESLATQDLDNLLDTIEAKSHYATERYLARKVINLDLRLKESSQTAESELSISREENARLVRENEALMAQVIALARGGFDPPPNYDETPKMRGGGPAYGQFRQSSQASSRSIDSFASDDLQDIFHQAAAMYIDSSQPPLLGKKPTWEHETVASVTSEKGRNALGQFSVPSIEMPEVLIEAKKMCGMHIPEELDAALLKASLSGASKNVEEFLEEASEIYGNPIPREVQVALRRASVGDADSYGAMPPAPNRATSSSSSISHLSTSLVSVEDGIDIILGKAERMYGNEIPSDVANAFRSASRSTLSKTISRVPSPKDPEPSNLQAFDITMDELHRLYGKPVPKHLTIALRQASMSSASLSLNSSLLNDCEIIHEPSVMEDRAEDRDLSGVSEAWERTESSFSDVITAAERVSLNDEILFESVDGSCTAPVRVDSGLNQMNRNTHASSGDKSDEASECSGSDDDTFEQSNDLDSILQEAQILSGNKLSASLIDAWRRASVTSYEDDDLTMNTVSTAGTRNMSVLSDGSEPTLEPSRSIQNEVIGFVADDLNAIFTEAARIYSQPSMRSEEFSFSPDDQMTEILEPSEPRRVISQTSVHSGRKHSIGSTKSDRLDDLYSEAAASYKTGSDSSTIGEF